MKCLTSLKFDIFYCKILAEAKLFKSYFALITALRFFYAFYYSILPFMHFCNILRKGSFFRAKNTSWFISQPFSILSTAFFRLNMRTLRRKFESALWIIGSFLLTISLAFFIFRYLYCALILEAAKSIEVSFFFNNASRIFWVAILRNMLSRPNW